MRNQREHDKGADFGPTQPTTSILPASYPMNISVDSSNNTNTTSASTPTTTAKEGAPRQRRFYSRSNWKNLLNSSSPINNTPESKNYSPVSSFDVHTATSTTDSMEKGYNNSDDVRRRVTATSSMKRSYFLSWNTQSAALFCCLVAPVAAFTIISRGTLLRRWRSVSDHVALSQCGGVGAGGGGAMWEPEAIQALKVSSTLEKLKHGVVASDQAICSKIGLALLRDHGGNAIDAAVATALCVGVINPASSGIGGGTFILVHSNTEPKTEDLPLFHDKRNHKMNDFSSAKNSMVTEVIDAREIAPSSSTTNMFLHADEHASTVGGLAPAIPGELRGLELAHARHGRLPWSKVVEPAMELARDGVPVSPTLAREIKKITAKAQQLPNYPISLRKLITRDDNWSHPVQAGDTFKNPVLAQTLQAVMEKGADALYTGDLAAKWVEDVRAADGIFTLHDIESFRPTLRSPLVAEDINGFTLVGAPPPCTGGAVIAGVLRFLSGYQSPFASASDTLSVHRMVEGCRHAFALRMSLSDPEFNAETTNDVVYDLTRGKFMDSLRHLTKDDATLSASQYGGKWSQLKDDEGQTEAYDAHEGDRRQLIGANEHNNVEQLDEGNPQDAVGGKKPLSKGTKRVDRPLGYLEDAGTSHISVVDKDGNAVALTTSINSKFGSGVLSESTGILLNNQMDNFGTPSKTSIFGVRSSPSNYVKPGKKPLSSMSPVLLFRRQEGADPGEWGDLHMVVGGSGGPKIITAVLQVILNHVYRGMPLFESVAHPRVHDQLLYRDALVTTVEHSTLLQGPTISVSDRTRAALESRGHKLLDLDYMGTVQAVAVDPETGELSAVSDIRKAGFPAGY